jgi:hypothetical protein
MLSTFFKTKPVIDETSKAWIFDTFAWCIAELDGEFFKHDSKLVLPNNTFYPGSSNSVEEMANTIFSNTMKYAGMTAWPIKLVPAERFIQKPMPQLLFASRLRGESCNISCKVNSMNDSTPAIDIAFHVSQLNQPQDLIAYLVQIQAGILVHQYNAIHYDANKATAYSYVQVLFSVFIGWTYFSEVPMTTTIVGGGLIMVGALINVLWKR